MASIHVIIIISIIWIVDAGRVLIMPSSIDPTHRFIMRHLAGELINRGHHVVWWEYGLDSKSNIHLPKGFLINYHDVL